MPGVTRQLYSMAPPPERLSARQHAELGALLRGVIEAAGNRASVARPLDLLRCRLDDFASRDLPRSMPLDEFNRLYYGGCNTRCCKMPRPSAPESAQLLSVLRRADALICAHYAPHACQRLMRRHVSLAAAALQRWTGTP